MLRFFEIILVGLIVSFYFFPVELVFLPQINTKNLMAGFGLVLFCIHLGRKKTGVADVDFITLLFFSGLVSFIGLISVVYNDATDYTYSTYIVSMLIWLSSSYTVVSAIRTVHGKTSVELVINYLICVCVFQCILALVMNMNPIIKDWVNYWQPTIKNIPQISDRLYGFGCLLDIAGSRFAGVLIMMACICTSKLKKLSQNQLISYIVAFFVITIIGNMISRTTTIGVLFTIIYWAFFNNNSNIEKNRIWKNVGLLSAIVLPVVIFLYQTNPIIHKNIEFAFEGFFSLYKNGMWEVSSNGRLATMVVLPDNLKTWIIGDGYFNNPLLTNPYYIGPGAETEYYMYTDIGYLRFIFYFGIIGTLAFMLYMFKVASICMNRFSNYRMMFIMLLLLNYIVWTKVATDVFMIFALFLVISDKQEDLEE